MNGEWRKKQISLEKLKNEVNFHLNSIRNEFSTSYRSLRIILTLINMKCEMFCKKKGSRLINFHIYFRTNTFPFLHFSLTHNNRRHLSRKEIKCWEKKKKKYIKTQGRNHSHYFYLIYLFFHSFLRFSSPLELELVLFST